MKRFVSIGLCLLLLYHALGSLFVLLSVRVQEQYALSERLLLYPSTDSMVEFHIPLYQHPNEAILTQKRPEGFNYRSNYYEIVSLNVSGDTLHITGYQSTDPTLWKQDLLSLLKTQFGHASDNQKRTSDLLKLLGKEYSQFNRARLVFFRYEWRLAAASIRFVTPSVLTRHLPVFSPPPEASEPGLC